MLKFITSVFDTNKKVLTDLAKTAQATCLLEKDINTWKDEDFPARIATIRHELTQGKTIDDFEIEVMALVREASIRTIKQRPFDVQIMAALVLHHGGIAEQKTGEGKTLTAVPALVLNALSGSGAHLVTVNDYLARLGAGWMGQIFHFLGLSTGVIYSGSGNLPASLYDPDFTDASHTDERLRHLKPVSRKEAYAADITYGTNNEFGFDYLRDNMAQSLDALVQRGHHFAIVDEVDSILIDEARTPLIISAPDADPTDKYYRFAGLIGQLGSGIDYDIDEKFRTATLTEHGLRKLEKLLGIDNIYEKDFDTVHHMEQALKAKTLFQKDRDYVVKDNQIIIVDEHSGRLMFGRRYSDGLHQAIEAKEGVTIQQESRTLATISLQNYFRMYEKLSGMTGTAETEAEEFKKIYNLDVLVLPPNKPVIRKDHPDQIYKTARAKYAAIVREVGEKHQEGQPVLIGTKSIEQNDIISSFLKRKRIPHQVLNAKNHEKEASIISEAGRLKAVTVATNIAGRGVDIMLGGNPQDRDAKEWKAENQAVIAAGGLHVVGSIRNESRRIDNQLRGRSGRQGDPGSSRFYICLEDDIMRIFGGDQVKHLMDILKVPEDQPIEAGMVNRAIETAQGKVESFHFDQRKRVVEFDDVTNKQRQVIYSRRRQILEDATSAEKIHSRITNILQDQIHGLTQMLSAGGISDDEANILVQEFCQILPLDSRSQDTLKQFIHTQHEADKVAEHLLKLADQVYQSRKQQIGEALFADLGRFVLLSSLDTLWMDHLDDLDNLRDGINLRGFAQQDPLVEFKQEGFSMFESLLTRIDASVAGKIFRYQLTRQPSASAPAAQTSSKTTKALGRNDPCWCGSGKKWKRCHYPQLSPTA